MQSGQFSFVGVRNMIDQAIEHGKYLGRSFEFLEISSASWLSLAKESRFDPVRVVGVQLDDVLVIENKNIQGLRIVGPQKMLPGRTNG